MFAVEHSLEALDLKESTSVICLTVIKTVAHFIYQIGANTQLLGQSPPKFLYAKSFRRNRRIVTLA